MDEVITRVLHLDRSQKDSVGELIEYRGIYMQKSRRVGLTRRVW